MLPAADDVPGRHLPRQVAACRPPPAICHLPPTTHSLPPATCRPPPATFHPPPTLPRLQESTAKIASVSQPFLAAGSTVLVHGRSSAVLAALAAAADTKDLLVLVTRASGGARKELEAMGLRVEEVADLGVAAVMHRVDSVLLGAEGVVETGGVVSQLGTYTVATVARALGKPTYVLAESFKFVREYPLGQEDLPREYLHHASELRAGAAAAPRVDYTPPALVSLLFTDLGILTPSAVSDELINLYL